MGRKKKKKQQNQKPSGGGVFGSKKNPLITHDSIAAQIKKARQAFEFFARGIELGQINREAIRDFWMKIGDASKVSKDIVAVASNQVAAVFEAAKTGNLRIREIFKDEKSNTYEVSHVPPEWTPFEEASLPDDVRPIVFGDGEAKVYMNSRYQVIVREDKVLKDKMSGEPLGPPMTHLSIKRLDRTPVRSWRELQRIKNELVGEDCEAAELFPAEERLIDTANQYHLYCLKPPHKFPFGTFSERMVSEETVNGARQDPWEEGNKPDDLLTSSEVVEKVEGHIKAADEEPWIDLCTDCGVKIKKGGFEGRNICEPCAKVSDTTVPDESADAAVKVCPIGGEGVSLEKGDRVELPKEVFKDGKTVSLTDEPVNIIDLTRGPDDDELDDALLSAMLAGTPEKFEEKMKTVDEVAEKMSMTKEQIMDEIQLEATRGLKESFEEGEE